MRFRLGFATLGIFIGIFGTFAPPTAAIKCYVCSSLKEEKCAGDKLDGIKVVDCNLAINDANAYLTEFYSDSESLTVDITGLKPKEDHDYFVPHWSSKPDAPLYTQCITIITMKPDNYFLKTSDKENQATGKNIVLRQCAYEFVDEKQEGKKCHDHKVSGTKVRTCTCNKDICNKESGSSRIIADFNFILLTVIAYSVYFFAC